MLNKRARHRFIADMAAAIILASGSQVRGAYYTDKVAESLQSHLEDEPTASVEALYNAGILRMMREGWLSGTRATPVRSCDKYAWPRLAREAGIIAHRELDQVRVVLLNKGDNVVQTKANLSIVEIVPMPNKIDAPVLVVKEGGWY
jgi:hypothetical protein